MQNSIKLKLDALSLAAAAAKREAAKLDNEYNQALAQEKRQREAQQKAYETELSTREILNHVNGVFLTEKPDVFNIGQGHKVRVDVFKGMTKQQKQDILDIQEQQRQANQDILDKKRQEEQKWALQDLANRRSIAMLDRASQRAAREKAIAIRKENELKAIQDRQRFVVLM